MLFHFIVIPKYYAYPKLLLLLNYAGVLLEKDKLILSQGIGTTDDVDKSSKAFHKLCRDAIAELRSRKGTCPNNIYYSVDYFKNLSERDSL